MADISQMLTPDQSFEILKEELRLQEEAKKAKEQAIREELATRLEYAPTNIDWTPLAAQLDQMYGGQVAQKAARSRLDQTQEAQAKADALMGKIGSPAQAGLSTMGKLAIEGLKQGQKRSGIEETQKASQEFSKNQKNLDRQIEEDQKAASWVEKEINEPLKQSSNDIGMAEAALAGNDIAALNQSLPSIARGIVGQKGVLSDTDIALTIPKTYASTLAEFMKRINGEAEIPPSLVANVRALIARAKDNIHRNASNALKAKENEVKQTTMAKQLGYVTPVYKNSRESDIVKYFEPAKKVEKKIEAPAQPIQAAPQSSVTFEQLKAQVEAAKKGKQ